MNQYEALTSFLPALREDSFGAWSAGVRTPDMPADKQPAPVLAYSPTVTALSEALRAFCAKHPEFDTAHYSETLRAHGLGFNFTALSTADVSEAGPKLLLALLTAAWRAEGICEGTVLDLLREGVIQRWLDRLETVSVSDKSAPARAARSARAFVLFGNPEAAEGYLTSEYPCALEIDGQTYTSAQQYLLVQKALLFGDSAGAEKILAASDPVEQRKLASAIKNVVSVFWEGRRQLLLYRATREKFRQNPALREALLATQDALLVYASRTERVWGAGLAAADPAISNPLKWKGMNQLGFVLQQVREELSDSSDGE